MMPKAKTYPDSDHDRITLLQVKDPNPRCGDCIYFTPGFSMAKCSLKNKAIRIYNKCEFFKRIS